MAESHVEAPQASRVAQHVRAGRAARRETTDITAAFDQILASAAQPAQQAAPQVPPSAPSSTLDANLVESREPEFPQKDENTPVDVRPADDRPAPDLAPSPVRPEHSAHANHVAVSSPAKTVSEFRPRSAAAAASHHARTANAAPERPSERKPAATREGVAVEAKTGAAQREPRANTAESRLAASQAPVAKPAAAAAEKTPVDAKRKSDARPAAHTTNNHAAESKAATTDAARSVAATKDGAGTSRPRATNVAERPNAAKPPTAAAEASSTPTLQSQSPQPQVQAAVAAPAPGRLRRVREQGEFKGKAIEPGTAVRPAASPSTEAAAQAQPAKQARPTAASSVEPVKTVAKAKANDPTVSPTAPAVASGVMPTAKPRDAAAVEIRRPREARTAPSANVEARTTEPAAVTTVQTSAAAPQSNAAAAPIAASAAPATPVIVHAAATPTPAMENKPVAPASVDRALPESHSPLGTAAPGREHGKTLLDNAKAVSAQARQRTDQQQQVERVRLVERVAKALQTAQDRGAPLKLRLTPPELGVLRIELSVRNGALSARLEAETPAAKMAILENLPALRERLTAQEIKIERFDVDLMQQPDGSPGERHSFADAESSRERAAARQWKNGRQTTSATPPTNQEPRSAPVRLSPGRLNVLA